MSISATLPSPPTIHRFGIDFNVINPDAQLPGNLEPPDLLDVGFPEIGLGITLSINAIRSRLPFDAETLLLAITRLAVAHQQRF